MIREKEKKTLERISFVGRFISTINTYQVSDLKNQLKLKASEISKVLAETEFEFVKKRKSWYYDVFHNGLTFRLLFDANNSGILTYIFILKHDKFLNNGLSHFAYMLNDFDLSKYEIEENFGFENYNEFKEFVGVILSIFHDFVKEYDGQEEGRK